MGGVLLRSTWWRPADRSGSGGRQLMLPRAIAPVSGALAPLRPSGMGFGGDTPGLPERLNSCGGLG